MSHIAVERNRRRQMNEHLKTLRSLTPALYVKRGDQASIIGGAVDFIRELHVLLEALNANKRRRLSNNTLHPLPSTPTTPSPRSLLTSNTSSPGSGGSSSNNNSVSPNSSGDLEVKELAACCSSAAAEVEARISGANVLLRTLSGRAPPGQAAKMVALLQGLHLDVLHLNVSTLEDTVLHSFVLQIGLECQLSVEDLAFEVHQTFCCDHQQQQQDQQQLLLLDLPIAAVHGDIMIN